MIPLPENHRRAQEIISRANSLRNVLLAELSAMASLVYDAPEPQAVIAALGEHAERLDRALHGGIDYIESVLEDFGDQAGRSWLSAIREKVERPEPEPEPEPGNPS